MGNCSSLDRETKQFIRTVERQTELKTEECKAQEQFLVNKFYKNYHLLDGFEEFCHIVSPYFETKLNSPRGNDFLVKNRFLNTLTETRTYPLMLINRKLLIVYLGLESSIRIRLNCINQYQRKTFIYLLNRICDFVIESQSFWIAKEKRILIRVVLLCIREIGGEMVSYPDETCYTF